MVISIVFVCIVPHTFIVFDHEEDEQAKTVGNDKGLEKSSSDMA